ncbi:hypothetical protein LJR047_000648 [Knoellia sp. LjRoot47]
MRSGWGSVSTGPCSSRRTPRTDRTSVSACRAAPSIAENSPTTAGSWTPWRSGALWAWTTIIDMWCATTSCSSRAIRLRSSTTARRARSVSTSSCWTAIVRREMTSQRTRRATPMTSA